MLDITSLPSTPELEVIVPSADASDDALELALPGKLSVDLPSLQQPDG